MSPFQFADVLLVLVAAPMDLLQYFARHFDESGHSCRLAEYSRVLVAVASVLNLLAVTVERFVVIVFPLRSRSICTMTNCRRSLLAVWALSALLAAPVLLTKSVYRVHYGDDLGNTVTVTYCNDQDDAVGLVKKLHSIGFV